MAFNNDLGDDFYHNQLDNLAPTGLIHYYNLVIKSAKGSIVTDINGNHYIDLLGSASAVNVGHNHPKVAEAMKNQIDQLIAYNAGYFPNPTEIELTQKLAKIAPGNDDKKVSFGTSGSDANDGIIKFARAATGRSYIVSFDNAYHGTTYGALSVGACGPEMVGKVGPLLPNIIHVPFPDYYHDAIKGESEHDFSLRLFKAFTQPFSTYLPTNEVACVLIEPIQGDSGIIIPPKEYMSLVHDFCQNHGILFATDEINQGFGRSGKMWASEHFDIVPDLISTGKSLSAGMPMSAVIGSAEIMDSLNVSSHVFTAGGNPVVAAAANAVLDIMQDEGLVEKSAQDGEYAKKRFLEFKDRYQFIGDVRMLGLNGGIEIVKDRQTKQRDNLGAAEIIFDAFQKGLILVKLAGNVLRFQPPLVITRQELDRVFDIFEEVFNDFEQDKIILSDELRNMSW